MKKKSGLAKDIKINREIMRKDRSEAKKVVRKFLDPPSGYMDKLLYHS